MEIVLAFPLTPLTSLWLVWNFSRALFKRRAAFAGSGQCHFWGVVQVSVRSAARGEIDIAPPSGQLTD